MNVNMRQASFNWQEWGKNLLPSTSIELKGRWMVSRSNRVSLMRPRFQSKTMAAIFSLIMVSLLWTKASGKLSRMHLFVRVRWSPAAKISLGRHELHIACNSFVNATANCV